MSVITVTNADEESVRRFGEWIGPGKTLQVSSETVIAYSAMEMALASQIIARKVSKFELLYELELKRQAHDRESRNRNLFMQNFSRRAASRRVKIAWLISDLFRRPRKIYPGVECTPGKRYGFTDDKTIRSSSPDVIVAPGPR